MEKILEVFSSEEYNAVVVPDEAKLFDRTKTQMLPGYLAHLLERETKGAVLFNSTGAFVAYVHSPDTL